MSAASFNGRHVLVVGQRLAPVAQEALGQARFEIAAADRLDVLASLHTAMDLVLIDADATDPTELVGAIAGLAARASPPAVLLAGGHLPTSLVACADEAAALRRDRGAVHRRATSPAPPPPCSPTPPAAGRAGQRPRAGRVMGSVGGCGATTIAVELATAPGAAAAPTSGWRWSISTSSTARPPPTSAQRRRCIWPTPRRRPSASTRPCSTPLRCESARRRRPLGRAARSEGVRRVTPDRGLPAAGDRLPGLRLDRHRPAAPPASPGRSTCWPAPTRCWWSPS